MQFEPSQQPFDMVAPFSDVISILGIKESLVKFFWPEFYWADRCEANLDLLVIMGLGTTAWALPWALASRCLIISNTLTLSLDLEPLERALLLLSRPASCFLRGVPFSMEGFFGISLAPSPFSAD